MHPVIAIMEGSIIPNFCAKCGRKMLKNKEVTGNFLFEQLSIFLAYLSICMYATETVRAGFHYTIRINNDHCHMNRQAIIPCFH